MSQARSLAAMIAIAATPLLAHADAYTFTTPNFQCSNGSLSGINWRNASEHNPTVIHSGTTSTFNCGASPSVSLRSGSRFTIDFGSLTIAGHKLSDATSDPNYRYTGAFGTLYANVDPQTGDIRSDFDYFIDFTYLDPNTRQSVTVHDFLGIEIFSKSQSFISDQGIYPNLLTLLGNHIGFMDFTVPTSPIIVSFYSSPRLNGAPPPPSAVPEPNALLLLGSGVLGLPGLLRRKK